MQSLFLKHPAAPVMSGAVLAVVIATALTSAGAFSEGPLPLGFSSYRQLLGINILLILLPSYLMLAWGLQHRRCAALLAQVDEMLDGDGYRQRVNAPAGILATGAGLGVIYAMVFNLPDGTATELVEGRPLLMCLVAMIILLWVSLGLVIASRLHVAGLFRAAGNEVPIDPFDQSSLGPFARAGMGDVMVTAGGLVLSTVQSIDAMFRYENYFYTLVVAVPAATVLLLRPMTTIHKRLRALKDEALASVNERIRAAPKTLAAADMAVLEPLLQRRDRINAVHTWPLDVSMISRLLIYGVIPPAAWVGAALVERVVESLLGG